MPSLSEETQGNVSALMPGATIGIIGGGQLGRMMALSARYMGFRIGVLDPSINCPAAQVADFHISSQYDDAQALYEFAQRCDVLTYEFENVDADALDQVRGCVAVPQGTDILRITQDRVYEKQFINDHGSTTARWQQVDTIDDFDHAIATIGLPAILKTRRGGYDGIGQYVLRSDEDVTQLREQLCHQQTFIPSILEGFVNFVSEASILVAGNGVDFVTFPLVRNDHRNNILHMTFAPASVSEHVHQQAQALAVRLAQGFHLAGVLAVELFITDDDQVIVNELAPRPHNSGHYTIEACDFDQFDLHIRGIVGWSLQQPKLLSPAIMVNILGQHVQATETLLADHPNWHAHYYGKQEARYNRKMGHITVLTDDLMKTAAQIEATGCWQCNENQIV